MTIALRSLSLAFVFAVASSAALRAQDPPPPPKDPDEVVKAAKKDTYTNGDEKAMKALGVVAYGPLMWSDNMRTPTIEKVLGEGRIMWMETEHFLLGTNLASIGIPQNPDARKAVNAELGRLKKKWSKMPDRATKLDPWLRAHLFALRCEELYEDFAKLTAHDPKSGTFLGQPGKFSVLLFQKKSDLVRYLDAFCGRKHDGPIRHLYPKSSTNGVVLSAEGEDPYDDPSLQRLFRFNLVQAFVDARGGAPYWLSTGLAHWYARQIEANIMTCAVRDGESVDEHTQNEWEDKIKARAPRESLCTPLVKLFAETELGYYGHLQAWSHVDHLLALDRTKFGEFFTNVKGGATPALQEQLLQQLYGMDAATCDAKWREWAVKAYK